MKVYLEYENTRNKQHAALYTAMMHIAFGKESEVLIGHHLTFEQGGDLNTENEIPSADCLIFDHAVMKAVFGDKAVWVMRELASVACDERDALLKQHFESAKGPLRM